MPASSAPILPYNRQPVEFQEYDPRAPEVAQYVINLIQVQIPSVRVEHIGSTAVPGCGGRGVIDLMILYDMEAVEPILVQLDILGFQWVQRDSFLPDEWPKGMGAVQYQEKIFRLHIHVQPSDLSSVSEKRIFRDRLRSDPELLSAYMAHKREILARGTVDPIEYTSAKSGFVEHALNAHIKAGKI
jgi:GrpB-like predicted nucleotidyltransferase (UPF0157 family)